VGLQDEVYFYAFAMVICADELISSQAIPVVSCL
jgi:hypothetical protein